MSRTVNVRKDHYTHRDNEKGKLSGTIKCYIETLSYIHISSGRQRIVYAESIEPTKLKFSLSTIIEAIAKGDKGLLNELTKNITVDYMDNVAYGSNTCIPGSTVKGLLRARLELCKSRNALAIGCMKTRIQRMSSLPPKGKHGWRHALVWNDVVLEYRGDQCNPAESNDYTICKICDIFGAPGIAGRVMPSNFCISSSILGKLDLPYGEKVWAIPPNSKLYGSIIFTSLDVEEIGILLIAMGFVKGSVVDRDAVKGMEVLIGKHKYVYKNMGNARFGILSIDFPHRFRGLLNNYGITYGEEDTRIVIKDAMLVRFIDAAIDRALNVYPQLQNLYGFSEAQMKQARGVAV